jgi:hypothetical protein
MAIMTVEETQDGLVSTWTHLILVYTDGVNAIKERTISFKR